MEPHEADLVSFAFSGPAFDPSKPIYIDARNPLRAFNAIQFRRLVRSLIAGLRARGVERGDCVLVQLENSVIHSALFFAIVGAGGVYMGCDVASPLHELTHLLRLAEPRLIITAPSALSRVLEVCNLQGIPSSQALLVDEQSIETIVQFAHSQAGQTEDPSTETAVESTRLENLLQYGESDWLRFEDSELSKSTPAAMFLTSGTSGLPKAAIRTHHTIISHHLSVHYQVPYPVVRLMALPLYHSFGDFWGNIFPIRYGEPLYVLPRFEISAFLDSIRQHHISETYMVPAMVHILNKSSLHVAESLSTLRYIGISGAPIDGHSMQHFQSLLSPDAVAGNLWGMSEVGVVFQNRFGVTPQFGSVGTLLPGYELRFVNPDTGEDVAGTSDSPGELYSVAPAEIEGILLTDPGVKDAAVIGVMLPDGSSEVPRAYVVRTGTFPETTADQVASLIQGQLASYKALDGGVIFVDEIPRTGIGKPHRAKLSQLDRQREKIASIIALPVAVQ
ncbi:Orotidine 5'-phosphate decarboxylase [Penicillium robsamsonii]|uniref:Orotidine 5'-phosphate decarboxylase n=1 Tax=Penicillium robsamsonii TaxID=1792511 RepID=UPI002548C99E|nr:Orotidine 5'-phosphate decarboxylase [Penicillium robsamsonii]KAJ5815885.1 Orotidine 5'-phosphate decarboxylase [Penicillium robsamsonii]